VLQLSGPDSHQLHPISLTVLTTTLEKSRPSRTLHFVIMKPPPAKSLIPVSEITTPPSSRADFPLLVIHYPLFAQCYTSTNTSQCIKTPWRSKKRFLDTLIFRLSTAPALELRESTGGSEPTNLDWSPQLRCLQLLYKWKMKTERPMTRGIGIRGEPILTTFFLPKVRSRPRR